MDQVADGLMQSSFGHLPMTEVVCFPWATHFSAYPLSARRICVQLKFPSLDRGTIATCPISVQTLSMFIPGCLCFILKSPIST